MYSFERFKQSTWSLVILAEGRIIFRSRAKAVMPLRRFLAVRTSVNQPLVIYDKYVGRAAALLMALIRPTQVFTPVVSEAGKATLEHYAIAFEADAEVKYLMGIASDDMFRWEKMSLGKSPEEFLALLDNSESA